MGAALRIGMLGCGVVGTGVAADGRREAIVAGLGKRGQIALVCTERPH